MEKCKTCEAYRRVARRYEGKSFETNEEYSRAVADMLKRMPTNPKANIIFRVELDEYLIVAKQEGRILHMIDWRSPERNTTFIADSLFGRLKPPKAMEGIEKLLAFISKKHVEQLTFGSIRRHLRDYQCMGGL